ncbi:putative maleylacetate reductase [Trichoderma sp. SZMC 28014]
MNFVYQSHPAIAIFGRGTLKKVPEELSRLGCSKPLLLCTPEQTSQVEALKTILNGKMAGVFPRATMHTPITITEEAVEMAKSTSSDSVISIGGGSTIGLGKAISFRTNLIHLAIPTTYAGSEVTPVLGETQDGRKMTKSDPKILPSIVIYDVDLTMTLPVALTAASGVNAIAHAIEALYAQNGNPIINLMALEGVKSLAESLPVLVKDSHALEARSRAQYGAWLCGICLGSVGMSLHHKICHTLGGSLNLPHAETHTVILPHALSYNAPNVPEAMRSLAQVLPESNGDAIRGLNVLLDKLGVKRDLKTLGMKEADVQKAAEITLSNPYWNPRAIERGSLQEIIRRAWAGEIARADI